LLTIVAYGILLLFLIVAILCVWYGKTLSNTTGKLEINGTGIFGYVLAGIIVVIFLTDNGYDLYNKIKV